jgi:hypothetical protein
MSKSWNQDFANARAAEEFFTVDIHQESIHLFEQFIQECRELEIELLMVYTPEHVLGQEYIANREEIFEIFNRLSQENKIPFFDYSNHEICKDTSYFYNASHLNLEGTEIFNAQLADDLIGQFAN